LELADTIEQRRMHRSFTDEPVDPATLDVLLDRARRAPSAGNAQGTDFVVLEGPDQTARYWDLTLPLERRARFRWPGLVAAPVLVVVVASPEAYVARYREGDKAHTGLGEGADRWPVPYWHVDAGMAVQNLLLGVVDEGLGACFFGLFDHAGAVLEALGVPADRVGVGTVAIGHPAPSPPGRSATRPRRALGDVVHRGEWSSR
jgi:nitroreductase